MTKQRNDASQTQKGILYQYVYTLLCCFQMRDGESVFIEQFGDVSTNTVQVEVKHYSDELTDLHPNFWNTMRNWMDDSFPLRKYSSLILLTTQKISDNSLLLNWNSKTLDERRKALKEIQANFNKQKSKSEKTQDLLNFVLAPERNDKLTHVLTHMFIDSAQPDLEHLWKQLKDVHAKSIVNSAKENFMCSLLGHSLSPAVYKNKQISYADFSKIVQEITWDYTPQTRIFPKAKYEISSEEQKQQEDRPYVKKIRDIEYHEAVNKAMTDYLRTAMNLHNDFQGRIAIYEELQEYESAILESFNSKRRFYTRNMDVKNIIKESQNFYDAVIDQQAVIPFRDYNDTPKYFQNGLLHGIIDYESDLKWHLTPGNENESND